MTEDSWRRDPFLSLFPCFFQFICCSLPRKSNVIAKELQQREMLTAFHRTLDDGWWSRAKSTVEKYVVVQVMELHDESEEEWREPSPGVQRCVNNGEMKGVHSRRGKRGSSRAPQVYISLGKTWCACRPYVSNTHASSTRAKWASKGKNRIVEAGPNVVPFQGSAVIIDIEGAATPSGTPGK